MIPSYSPPQNQNQLDPPQGIQESQPMQIPKIDHIIAHAKHPEFSYIYARPELQASASSTIPQPSTPSQNDASTPKKGRPREKKPAEGGEKKPGTKMRKNEIYDKYYIDTTKPKKTAPLKKVDLWDKDAWEDILNRKKKYFEFCKLTGELTNWKSDDEDCEGDDMSEGDDDLENIGRRAHGDFKEDSREDEINEDNDNDENENEHSREGEMQVEADNKEDELDQSESAQIRGEGESLSNIENKEEGVRGTQAEHAQTEHGAMGTEDDKREEAREKMQVENEDELPEGHQQNADMQQHE